MAVSLDKATSDRYIGPTSLVDNGLFSMSFYFKAYSLSTSAVFGASNQLANEGVAFYFTSGTLFFLWFGSASSQATNPTVITINKWIHIAAWGNRNARALYVDGLKGPVNIFASPTYNTLDTTIGSFHNGSSYGLPLDGEVSNVTIWDNKRLSDDEFVALSKGVNPYTIHPEFISHHWPLSGDGPANIQVRDVVGGVNLATINGTPINVDSIKLRGNRLF